MDAQNPLTGPVLLGFLRAGRVLDNASSVLLLASVLLVPGATGPAAAGAGLALLLGLAAKYLAWRVALDAEFFALLIAQPQQAAAFDAALAMFLGRTTGPAPQLPRSPESRWHGARRLLRRQAALVAAQAVAAMLLLLLRHLA